MPSDVEKSATAKIKEFKNVKDIVFKKLYLAQKRLNEAKREIKANVRSSQNKDGLLLGYEKAYLDCLMFKMKEFEALFRQDDDHWSENLEKAKKDRGDRERQI